MFPSSRRPAEARTRSETLQSYTGLARGQSHASRVRTHGTWLRPKAGDGGGASPEIPELWTRQREAPRKTERTALKCPPVKLKQDYQQPRIGGNSDHYLVSPTTLLVPETSWAEDGVLFTLFQEASPEHFKDEILKSFHLS